MFREVLCVKDSFGREINYIRVSVTDRCNLRCVYCVPEGGIQLKPPDEILSYEEMELILREAVPLGLTRVRLTGGEPLVRRGVTEFVRRVCSIPGIEDVSLTTNGILLDEMAGELYRAGIRRLNISLDTLKPERYRELTRGGDLHDVQRGIEKAIDLGFSPVKLNVVLIRGINDDETDDFVELCVKKPVHVRFIELMPLGEADRLAPTGWVSVLSVLDYVRSRFTLFPVEVAGNGPARSYRGLGWKGTIGFISAMSLHFCDSCNRIRLTSDGKLNPCLASSLEFSVKEAVRSAFSREKVRRVLLEAIAAKPLGHRMADGRRTGSERMMSRLGG